MIIPLMTLVAIFFHRVSSLDTAVADMAKRARSLCFDDVEVDVVEQLDDHDSLDLLSEIVGMISARNFDSLYACSRLTDVSGV